MCDLEHVSTTGKPGVISRTRIRTWKRRLDGFSRRFASTRCYAVCLGDIGGSRWLALCFVTIDFLPILFVSSGEDHSSCSTPLAAVCILAIVASIDHGPL